MFSLKKEQLNSEALKNEEVKQNLSMEIKELRDQLEQKQFDSIENKHKLEELEMLKENVSKTKTQKENLNKVNYVYMILKFSK